MMVDRMLISDVKEEILQMQLNINELLNPTVPELPLPVDSQPPDLWYQQQMHVAEEESKIKKEELPFTNSPLVSAPCVEPSVACSAVIKEENIKTEGNATEDLVAYRHHPQPNPAPLKINAMRSSSDVLKKEFDSFDDIESEITPSFIMKKCDSVKATQPQAHPPPPSLSYFNHISEDQCSTSGTSAAKADGATKSNEPYDEWLCIQKELNYLTDERRGGNISKSVKSPEEEIIEKQLDDLFNPNSEEKDSDGVSRTQVDSPLVDFFNSQQQDSGVGGSAGGSSGVPSDKSVENRLEALFGGTPLHNRSSEDNSPEGEVEKQADLIETRLEALFQGGESALDNASFLHKTSNFEMMQVQLSQKRHWTTQNDCDWDDGENSGKRQCLPGNNRSQDNDHRWLLDCAQTQNQQLPDHVSGGIRSQAHSQQSNAISAGNNHILNDNGGGNRHGSSANTNNSGNTTNSKRTSWNGDILLASATGDLDMLDTNLSLSLNNINSMCGTVGMMSSDVPSAHHDSLPDHKSSKNCFPSPVLGGENCDDTNLIGLGSTGGSLNNSSHPHNHSGKLNYLDRDLLGLDGPHDGPGKHHHQASSSQATSNDLQHQLNHINFDGSGHPTLNFEEDISRQVQNAIDSILNLQSNETEAALHFPLDQSFLVDSPQSAAMQRPPSSNKRRYHLINRLDDISDCISSAIEDGPDNASGHHSHHNNHHLNHVQVHHAQTHLHHHQTTLSYHHHSQASTVGTGAVSTVMDSNSSGAADPPVKTIIKS